MWPAAVNTGPLFPPRTNLRESLPHRLKATLTCVGPRAIKTTRAAITTGTFATAYKIRKVIPPVRTCSVMLSSLREQAKATTYLQDGNGQVFSVIAMIMEYY